LVPAFNGPIFEEILSVQGQQKGKMQEHNVMDMWKKGTVFHLMLLILITMYIFSPSTLHSLQITSEM